MCSSRVQEVLEKMAGVKKVRRLQALIPPFCLGAITNTVRLTLAFQALDAAHLCYHLSSRRTCTRRRGWPPCLHATACTTVLLLAPSFPTSTHPSTAQAHVDLEKGLATVSVDAQDAAAAAATLAKAVQELGFDAAPQA